MLEKLKKFWKKNGNKIIEDVLIGGVLIVGAVALVWANIAIYSNNGLKENMFVVHLVDDSTGAESVALVDKDQLDQLLAEEAQYLASKETPTEM